MKKKGIIILAACVLLLIVVVIAFAVGGGKKPYKDLDAAQIASATVRLSPPDKTVQIIEIKELVAYLKDVVIHNEDNSYTEYTGQGVTFTLTMTDGTQTEIMAFNPFLVIDGVGYKTDYEPCEALNNYANKLLNGDEVTEPGVADLAPMVYVNDTLYIQSSDQQGYPELKDEFVYLGKIESTASEASTPKENFQANHPVVGCEVYQYGENIVVHINDAYWLYTNTQNTEADTVQFHDKKLNRADLSAETLEWLERYNSLTEEEQLAISSIPSDLYELCGYGNATEDIAPTEVEPIDYPPMVMFNNILYTATSYSGDKEDLTAVGEIESYIDYGVPTENNQANDALVGCEIYTSSSAPDFIFVLNNGVYSPYKSTDGAGIE